MIVLCARYNGKISVWDHIMEKIFHAKLDTDIESPSHETHIDTLPSTCFFGGGLGKFSPSVLYGNACSNLNYSKVITASPVRLPLLLECDVVCRQVPKYFQYTFTVRIGRPLKTRQSTRVEFPRPRIGYMQQAVLHAGGRRVVHRAI